MSNLNALEEQEQNQHIAREHLVTVVSRVYSIWAMHEPNQVMNNEDLTTTVTDLLDIVCAAVGLYQGACPDDNCHMSHDVNVARLKRLEETR